MAVQKSRVTRARRGQRRSHDALKKAHLCEDALTGEVHLRHHLTPDGFYKGVRYVEKKVKVADPAEAAE